MSDSIRRRITVKNLFFSLKGKGETPYSGAALKQPFCKSFLFRPVKMKNAGTNSYGILKPARFSWRFFFLVPSGEEIPPGSTGERKSFRMRLSEGKQILESKRLNEKEI